MSGVDLQMAPTSATVDARHTMTTPRAIRPADVTDLPAVVALGQRFLAEAEYRGVIAENPAQMEALALRLITGDDATVLLVEHDGEPVGMIGLLFYPHLISAEPLAGELFWWVNPERRRDGVRLLRAAETWARDRGAMFMQMVAPNGRVGQFYEALGYVKVETMYQRTL